MRFHYCLKPNIWLKKREHSLQDLLAMLPAKIDKKSSVYSIIIVDKIMTQAVSEVKKLSNIWNSVAFKDKKPETASIKLFYLSPPVIVAAFLPVIYRACLKLNIKGGKMQHIVMIRGP